MKNVLAVSLGISLSINLLFIFLNTNTKKDTNIEDTKLITELKKENAILKNDLKVSYNKINQVKNEINEHLDQLATANIDTIFRNIPNGSPLKNVYVTDKFGKRLHPILKKYMYHKGLDLRARMNTRVYATADGIVSDVKRSNKGYGNIVEVSHQFGFKTLYAHLNRMKVRKGDVVKKGQIIALSGNSGLSTAPHLHYEVRFGSTPLNPYHYVKLTKSNYIDLKHNLYIDIDKIAKLNQGTPEIFLKSVVSGL